MSFLASSSSSKLTITASNLQPAVSATSPAQEKWDATAASPTTQSNESRFDTARTLKNDHRPITRTIAAVLASSATGAFACSPCRAAVAQGVFDESLLLRLAMLALPLLLVASAALAIELAGKTGP